MKEKGEATRADMVALAVISVVLVVIVVCGPECLPSNRERERRVSCISNLKFMALSTKQYSLAFDGHLPSFGDPTEGSIALSLLYPDYDPGLLDFNCTGREKRLGTVVTWDPKKRLLGNVSYAYRSGLTESDDSTISLACDLPPGQALTSEANHGVDGGNVLYLDGHAKWVTSEEWLTETDVWGLCQ